MAFAQWGEGKGGVPYKKERDVPPNSHKG